MTLLVDRGVKEGVMAKLQYLWARYGTARNVKVLYVLLSLVALAVAGGAPSAGGGTGGGLRCFFP